MSKIPKRDVGFFLYNFRAVLLGREHTKNVRFDSECSTRDGPPPNVPGGPAHDIKQNWYTNRDPRRIVEQPIVISNQKQLKSGDKVAQAVGERLSGAPVPGAPFKWDSK